LTTTATARRCAALPWGSPVSGATLGGGAGFLVVEVVVGIVVAVVDEDGGAAMTR
jgi:hypothetical protein